MTTPVQYTGTIKPFFEVAITGRQQSWMPGQICDRSDTDAALLIASGGFAKALSVVDSNQDSTDGIAGLTTAQAAAVVATRRRLSGPMGLFGTGFQNTAATYTPHMQYPALAPFYGVRLGIANRSSTAITVGAARVATPAVGLANSNTLTWSNLITWSGSATPTLPALISGSGNDVVPALSLSDVLFIPSVARTDDPTKRPLLQSVISFSSTGNACAAGSAAFAEVLAASGLEFASRIATSDIATAPASASSTPSAAGTFVCPNFVEFLYAVPARTVADCGDSRMRGETSATSTIGYNAPVARMCWLRNGVSATPSFVWTPLSFAMAGQHHSASYATGLQVAATLKPDYLVSEVYSANDTPVTQASIDQAWAETVDLTRTCEANGVVHVVKTAPPFNRGESEDVFRRTLNARLLASGLVVADVATPLQTPGDPKTLLAAYDSGDHIHLTSAGYDIEASVLDSVILPT